MPEYIDLIVTFLGGGAVGSIITACITSRRDKKYRRRVFVGFLQKWKAEIAAPNRGPTQVIVVTDPAILAYDSKLADFCEQVALVKGCYPDAERFRTLTIRVANLNANDWKNKRPCEVILEVIDALIEFCK